MSKPESLVPEFDEINLNKLFKQAENEVFDRTRGRQDSIGKAIAAFGTKNGGLMLVGQEDFKHGGEILGISEEKFQEEFTNAIVNVKPAPLTQQKVIETRGVKLVLIRIQDVGILRPCSYKGIYYERKGDSNPQLSPEEVKQYHLLYGAASTEDMPTHAKKDDIDENELEMYSKLIKKHKKNLLQSVTSKKGFLTVRGVMILSKRPNDFLEGAFIEIQRYDNLIGSVPIPVGPALKISKPARQAIEETTTIIQQNLPVNRTYNGAKMTQSSALPVSVIREAVTNAVAHRNYRSHEHIRIRIYADGFDINNPAAITEKMWMDILTYHTTYHPNEGIYTFLNPAQLYEGRGEGIWKIREELEKLGKSAPEFKVIGDSPSVFYVRISISPAKAKDVKRHKLEELISKREEITTSEVMKHLKVSRVTAIKFLNKLTEQGHLEHQGSTKTSKYVVKDRLRMLFNSSVSENLPKTCPHCGSSKVVFYDQEEDLDDLTDGQLADYLAGNWGTGYCETCHHIISWER